MSKKNFLPFEEAREFVLKLGFKNSKEWRNYCKYGLRPNNIPSLPNRVYKNSGWVSMGNWLGTGNVFHKNRIFLQFEDAREFARKLNLKGQTDWFKYCKSENKPNNIPTLPSEHYKNEGWVSWGDWLGTNKIATRIIEYLPFNKARKIVRDLGFKNETQWYSYCKTTDKPNNIPAIPRRIYKNEGWISMGDWLGYKIGFDGFLSFEKARDFVRTLKIKNAKEWQNYCVSNTKPNNIPSAPHLIYKNEGWVSIGDWVGTNSIKNGGIEYLDFKECRDFVRNLGLKSNYEWREYCKSGLKPDNIPANPESYYKKH